MMTRMGKGKAKSAMSSMRPCGRTRANNSSAIASMRGASASTRRGVNACPTNARKRVWSGGSAKSMFWLIIWERLRPKWVGEGDEAEEEAAVSQRGSLVNRLLSRKMASTSS